MGRFTEIRPILRKALRYARAGQCANALSQTHTAESAYDALGFREAKLESAVKRVRRLVTRRCAVAKR